MVQYKEGTRPSKSQGHDLFIVDYHPEGPARAALCFHHGIGEHVGRYKQVFTQLAEAGIAVYSGDTVGHGKSGGDRVYINHFSDVVDDFESMSDYAQRDLQQRAAAASSPPPPLFIGGHSLGGLVAPMTCLQNQQRWAGLVLSAPSLDVEWTPMLRVQAALGNLLAAVFPRARIVAAVDPSALNKDPAKVKEFLDDPLNDPGKLPARTANESLKTFRQLRDRNAEFTLPVYAIHGTRDRVTSLPATRAFIASISSTDKTLVEVPDGYHEALFEEGGERLVQGLADWVLQHAAQQTAARM